MNRTLGFVLLLITAGCPSKAPAPGPRALNVVAIKRRVLEELILLLGPVAGRPMTRLRELPPHMREVALGLYARDPGFVMTKAGCVPDAETAHGPTIEISSCRQRATEHRAPVRRADAG
jgi:hypothetical protein